MLCSLSFDFPILGLSLLKGSRNLTSWRLTESKALLALIFKPTSSNIHFSPGNESNNDLLFPFTFPFFYHCSSFESLMHSLRPYLFLTLSRNLNKRKLHDFVGQMWTNEALSQSLQLSSTGDPSAFLFVCTGLAAC